MEKLKSLYLQLETVDRISFLRWVHFIDEHKYDYATMGVSQMKFYDPTLKREDIKDEHKGPVC